MERNLQIGVIGSAADLKYGPDTEKLATDIGKAIGERGLVLVFGAEQDCDSLSTVSARAARAAGGFTMGVTYEKSKNIYDPSSATVVIPTGMVRGGGREMVQSLCADGIVAISGGSGTLNEITVAYQADIPVVVMEGAGGWSQELAGRYLDPRKRYQFEPFSEPNLALDRLLEMVELRQTR